MSNVELGALQLWELLKIARRREASDLHLGAGELPAIRVDGALMRLDGEPLIDDDVSHFANAMLPPKALARLYDRGDADAAIRHSELGSLRIHAFKSLGKMRIAIRLLGCDIPLLDRLQLPPVVQTFVERKAGLVLFVGPTGSGKTTTMAALVDRINRTGERHIVTIEDPIEFVHAPVRSVVAHRELDLDVENYEDALRGVLRSDPDVVVLGELRDAKTISAALRAAETGHLILSTLHTGDAAQTIDRIVDSFIGDARSEIRIQLAQTLIGVVSQRLVRRAGRHGRRAAVEILVATDAVRSLIREGKTHHLRNAIATGRSSGMLTLETHLSELVVRRDVTVEAAQWATDRPREVRTLAGSV